MDCMDGMKQFPDKYFDLAIVDPPYGGGASQNVHVERERERGYTGKLEELVELTPRGKIGRLNPEWVEWLMGFPIGWTESDA